MKKFVSIILVIAMALTCMAAFAETSPELEITVELLSAVPEGFELKAIPVEEADAWVADLYAAVAADPAAAFGDLGGTYNVDELFAVSVIGYEEGMDEVVAAIDVPTEYADGDQVVVEIAFEGEAFMALDAAVQNGAVIVTLPADVLAKLAAQQGVIAILSAE